MGRGPRRRRVPDAARVPAHGSNGPGRAPRRGTPRVPDAGARARRARAGQDGDRRGTGTRPAARSRTRHRVPGAGRDQADPGRPEPHAGVPVRRRREHRPATRDGPPRDGPGARGPHAPRAHAAGPRRSGRRAGRAAGAGERPRDGAPRGHAALRPRGHAAPGRTGTSLGGGRAGPQARARRARRGDGLHRTHHGRLGRPPARRPGGRARPLRRRLGAGSHVPLPAARPAEPGDRSSRAAPRVAGRDPGREPGGRARARRARRGAAPCGPDGRDGHPAAAHRRRRARSRRLDAGRPALRRAEAVAGGEPVRAQGARARAGGQGRVGSAPAGRPHHPGGGAGACRRHLRGPARGEGGRPAHLEQLRASSSARRSPRTRTWTRRRGSRSCGTTHPPVRDGCWSAASRCTAVRCP